MTNQHPLIIGDSRSDAWYTPTPLYNRIGEYFGHNWLDLAADQTAIDYPGEDGDRMKPTMYGYQDQYFTPNHRIIEAPHGLNHHFGVFCNPPGGKNRNLKYQLFEMALDWWYDGHEVLWLVYNINSLQPLIKKLPTVFGPQLLVFSKRLEYEGNQPSTGNFFGSALIRLPDQDSTPDAFKSAFQEFGMVFTSL
jgi:hypothetical protein